MSRVKRSVSRKTLRATGLTRDAVTGPELAGSAAGPLSLARTPAPQSEAERFADYELPPLTLLEDSQPLVAAESMPPCSSIC